MASIGSNTQYYSADATTTKWIGVDTVIVETITRTIDGSAMTITSTAAIAVSTAAPSDGGVSGDLNFIITPSAKPKLEELFKAIEAVCGVPGPARIKSRQTPGETCVTDYMVENAVAESTMDDLLSDGIVEGLGNLVDLLWIGAEDFVKTSTKKKVKVAGGLGVLAYALWKGSGGSTGGSIPDVVKVPAANIVVAVPATTATETEPIRIPPPVLTNMYHFTERFETPKAEALAAGLQNRFASLASAAVIAASTVLPNACKCTQVVQADGSLGSFDCINLGDGANCDVCIMESKASSRSAHLVLRSNDTLLGYHINSWQSSTNYPGLCSRSTYTRVVQYEEDSEQGGRAKSISVQFRQNFQSKSCTLGNTEIL